MAFFQRRPRWGLLLLAIWLLVENALALIPVGIPWVGLVIHLLGIAAGVLLLLER